MGFEDLLYSIGGSVEYLGRCLVGVFKPSRKEDPPSFKILRRMLKRHLTVHELLSLRLQLMLISYLIVSVASMWFRSGIIVLPLAYAAYMIFIRFQLVSYERFFVEPEPYRFFYYNIGTIAFCAFLGYSILRRYTHDYYYNLAYLSVVLIVVLAFRQFFRSRHGRDWTYGIVEEVKEDVVRVFIHDDIAANVKPGLYWLPAISEVKPGYVVRVLVEDHPFRSSRPVRILEVLEPQSSSTDTEPKAATE